MWVMQSSSLSSCVTCVLLTFDCAVQGLKQYTDGELHDITVNLGDETAVGLSLFYTPLENTSFEEVQVRR